jgi:tetratricopeptide (TPR) repeat protein
MQQTVNWDPNFEAAVAKFEESALSAQVRAISIHPFDKELFVSTLREQLLSFYTDIQKGYEVLAKTVLDLSASGVALDGMPPMNKRSMKAVKHLFPAQEAIDQFSNEEYVAKWAEEGKPMYQALGLSTQAVAIMYEAACYLLKENRDSDARSSFRLLLVLAPHMADFWVGYGVAQIRLGSLEEAVDSLERATSLDPLSVQALLLLCRALAELNRRGEAEARLGAGIDEAARTGNQERYELLEAARFELARFASKPKPIE